jgi:hypothetical protein
MLFGGASTTWGGGTAFYDARVFGRTLARAYRVTPTQFADVAAQEMHREPGEDLDLTEVMTHARHEVGPGRYETLHLVGELDGEPVLTFTARHPRKLPRHAPSPAYLTMLARGLGESHGLSGAQVVEYLLGRPGLGREWDEERLGRLVTAAAQP